MSTATRRRHSMRELSRSCADMQGVHAQAPRQSGLATSQRRRYTARLPVASMHEFGGWLRGRRKAAGGPEGGGMRANPWVDHVLADEALTRGLGDEEARVLVEWLVDKAEDLALKGPAAVGPAVQRL